MDNKPKFEQCWAILSGRVLLPWSIRSTRKQAIRDICRHTELDWRECKKRGYSYQKVWVEFTPND